MLAYLRRWFAPLVTALILLLVTLPYLLAARAAGSGHVFGGFLLNPLDGNTYLAKMYEGWRGDWQFTLPYTAEVGQGSYLFIYYILLGHLARLLGLSLPLVFHLFRLLGAAALLYALRRYLKTVLPDPRLGDLAFALAALGSGLGWAALPFGAFTADFWVAEAYPFLSAYANPHFPLGLALLCWLLTPSGEWGGLRPPLHSKEKGLQAVYASSPEPDSSRQHPIKPQLYCGAAFILSVISPFGVVLALLVFGGTMLWKFISIEKWRDLSPHPIPRPPCGRGEGECGAAYSPFSPGGRRGRGDEGVPRRYKLASIGGLPPLASRFLCVLFGGLPLLLYDLWVSRTDPHLAAWNGQNLTPSPPVLDVILSLSPALLLALAGAWVVLRRDLRAGRQLLVWAGLGLLLLYLPFGLQRRFMMGLFIPFSALAALGVDGLSRAGEPGVSLPGRYRLLSLVLLLFSFPTNLVVLLAAGYGVQTHDPMLYLSRQEAQAFEWIEANAPEQSLVLASPETGLLLPAYTGRRVIYGHPYETVNAEAEKQAVLGFFQGSVDPSPFLLQRGVDYLVIGPRERSLGSPALPDGLPVVFRSEDVLVYAVHLGRSETE